MEGEPLTPPGEANGESRVQTDGGGPAGKTLMEMMGKTFGPWEQHILRPTQRKQQVFTETERESIRVTGRGRGGPKAGKNG